MEVGCLALTPLSEKEGSLPLGDIRKELWTGMRLVEKYGETLGLERGRDGRERKVLFEDFCEEWDTNGDDIGDEIWSGAEVDSFFLCEEMLEFKTWEYDSGKEEGGAEEEEGSVEKEGKR